MKLKSTFYRMRVLPPVIPSTIVHPNLQYKVWSNMNDTPSRCKDLVLVELTGRMTLDTLGRVLYNIPVN